MKKKEVQDNGRERRKKATEREGERIAQDDKDSNECFERMWRRTGKGNRISRCMKGEREE